MAAAFRAIHTAAPCSVAVVQDLGRQACQDCTGRRLEQEGRHCRCILAKIHDQSLTRIDLHCLSLGELLYYHHFTELFLAFSFHPVPGICLDRGHREVPAEIDLSTIGREYIPGELGIDFRFGQLLRRCESRKFAGIIFLTVEYRRMFHRTGDPGFPIIAVCSVEFDGSVGINELQDSPEGAFLSDHTFMSSRSEDLVGPPPRSHLGSQFVLSTGLGDQSLGDIICKGNLGLLIMCESRLQYLFPDRNPVDIKLIHTQSGSHPPRGADLLVIDDRGNEPAGSVGGTAVGLITVDDLFGQDRSIHRRYPFRGVPS